ncbi:hypothetical protein SMGD1_0090 [Sulfurimonas gotlandica GD1]|uniref:Uncharacterized protein n=1 Tax=Sulfurimonas gotlandica (strain DSM 19862 / JCM 16533 / GD1) TaxID=929558 RepID=B6BLG1_SULGG|nr:hypothetical protein [Sulfurimonas gotlandica]EDZ62185.1 conserved hypothetical protein [Sulfurimonas gotlandica GD1]EHP28617.1 hypothetical protein SMGD1_0090 [Sulfurimonas gotlandica GD1]
MSHKYKSKIEKLFEHPVSGNIDVKRLLSALEHYEVEVEISKHNKAKLLFNNKEFIMALSHSNDLSKDSISKLRHYLEEVGLTPDKL